MIDLNGIRVKNRIWLTAGVAGYGNGWPWEKPFIKLGLIDFSAFGAVITKTLTLEPKQGNYIDPFEFEKMSLMSHLCRIFSKDRKRVLRKIPSGWLNNFGWWNVGIDYWTENIYPSLGNVSIIPNIGGFSIEEYLKLIEKLNPLNITAVEINISCPNVEINYDPQKDLPYLFRAAKTISQHPLILKIGSSERDIGFAQTAAALGFNAISLINTVPGAIVTKEGVFRGGQSGRRIKEIALTAVLKLKEALDITKTPIIGGGGIASWKDCQDFFEVGADAIALGSGFLSLIRFWLSWEPTRIAKKYGKQKDPI